MNSHSKLLLIGLLGLLTYSTHASEGGAKGNGDVFGETCQNCNQIPMPAAVCDMSSVDLEYCGSEDWIRGGVADCKRFLTVTIHCSLGGTQKYTTEYWAGAGYYCSANGQNHDCHL